MGETGTTQRGLAILGWMIALSTLLTATVDAAGLKYAQRETWLTDVVAFQLGPVEAIDVAILGSSKAGFGLSPSVLDSCLTSGLGRPAHAVNLARMFGAAFSFERLAQDLLEGERKPKLLLVSVEPETFNAYNPQTSMTTPFHADLADIPALLAAATTWDEAVAAGRVVTRGAENLGAYVTDASETEPRLRWLMMMHGGGQWCFGTPECERRNADFWRTQVDRWDERVATVLAEIRDERFARYTVGEGINHDGMIALVDWARRKDVALALVDMPIHQVYLDQIPPEMLAAYQAYLHGLSVDYGIPVFDGNLPELRDDRGIYLDPDHLNPRGAEYFTGRLCDELVLGLLK